MERNGLGLLLQVGPVCYILFPKLVVVDMGVPGVVISFLNI